MNGYRDERDNIVQRRPTIRTENDNFILETPPNRNITLSPGQNGYVKIGDTIIDPNMSYQVILLFFIGFIPICNPFFLLSRSACLSTFDGFSVRFMKWSFNHRSRLQSVCLFLPLIIMLHSAFSSYASRTQ